MSSLAIYYHRQQGPLCLLVYATAALLAGTAWYCRNEPPQPFLTWILSGSAMLVFLSAASFHHLTVADEIDRLRIRFGPIPLFQRAVLYEEIVDVEVGRTSILDGWGIHLSLRGGWVMNLWGRDCVVLKLKKGTLRVGTDDAENLAAFVKSRLPEDPEATRG
ncbi:hypothetical protein [Gimesia panareensis]|uniref:hypothetical protein n=1 Tax=Gimesia panareensis TaxID=2527978 RepID=UPI001189B454|nr:hypothetical protein [Gimesia panareensis]QDU52059.1 hypothetical protein Pan110_44290 [Gimesia panareensis]